MQRLGGRPGPDADDLREVQLEVRRVRPQHRPHRTQHQRMRDELPAGHRTSQQRPGALGAPPHEIVTTKRRRLDERMHLPQQLIDQRPRHQPLDDRRTRRGLRTRNIARRRISRKPRNRSHGRTVVLPLTGTHGETSF